jgi:hypothetical protein
MPRFPVAVLSKLLGNPADLVEADLEVGAIGPEAAGPKPPKRAPSLAHPDHVTGSLGVQPAPAPEAAAPADLSQVPTYLRHGINLSGL